MSAAAGRRGATTRLVGVMILFLGLLNAMLSWRGGFALSTAAVVITASGLFLYVLGAIRGGDKTQDGDRAPRQKRSP